MTTPQFDQANPVPLYINGEPVRSTSTFDVTNATGSLLWPGSSASDAQVDAAIASADAAFKPWSKLPMRQRADIIIRAVTLVEQRQDELIHVLVQEVGSPPDAARHIFQAMRGMVMADIDDAQSIRDEFDSAHEAGTYVTLHQPWGVVLSIGSWNGPYPMFLRAVGQPLVMGNTVVFKGSERAPACYAAICAIFIEAGVPPGVVNTIYSKAEDSARVVERIIAHPAVRKLNFTGSSSVGASIAAVAGRYLKPCVLELGGKSSSIVCEDADLAAAAQSVAVGAFIFGGQVCVGTERVIVLRPVAEQFKALLGPTITAIFGEGEAARLQLHAAPLAQRNRTAVADAVAGGARLIHGDPSTEDPSSSKMAPVVLEGVDATMALHTDESFGPSLSLYTVDTEDAAVALANDTQYGLAGAIWTRDLARGIRLGREMEAGCIRINGTTMEGSMSHAMGGWKSSGYGRFGGRAGLLEWVQVKTLSWAT